MPRLSAPILALACTLMPPLPASAAQLGFTCMVTLSDTGNTEQRVLHIDTEARAVRDNGMVTIEGIASTIARNQVEFVDVGQDRIAWGSRLRATGADVLVFEVNLRTRCYAFTSRLRGLRAQGTCQDTAGAT